MNVSLNWLSALLGTRLDPDETAERLALLGAPVETVEPLHQDLREVLVAQVASVGPHPNADRLSLCQVDTGTEVVEVVCGAPNVEAGAKYPYAPLGATLPEGVKLKGRKIRGVLSNGMLCSARELHLGADHEGILRLDTDATPGTPLLDALPDLGDYRLDIEVTPNRPDLLGHRGVARDLAAVLDRAVKLPTIPGAPVDVAAPVTTNEPATADGVGVAIEDPEGCPRYIGVVIRDVTVAPSATWLQRRLLAVGLRPINNVVDATNYVLMELNQPMHAFDCAKLRDDRIVVRRARDGETITTLDGVDRVLDASMTVIADGEGPVAVGGVMGGRDSEVRVETRDVFLECAFFAPERIRRTRTALKMSTDASYRYERGTDLAGMPDAVRRAVGLLLAVTGGRITGSGVDVYPRPEKKPAVFLRPDRVEHLLGVPVPQAEIERVLTRLGFSVGPKDGRLAVHAPGWRPDVTREVDLIEEIARLRGYDTFPVEHRPLRPSAVPSDPSQALEAGLRRRFTAAGLHEARSSSLVGQGGDGPQTALQNPLSAEEGFLRGDLLSGLTRAVEFNWSMRTRDIRLFEIGTVFTPIAADPRPRETRRLAAVISGRRTPAHWTDEGPSVDFDRWDVKSLLEEALAAVGLDATPVPDENGWVVRRNDELVGRAGPLAADAPAWAAPVWGFEVSLTDAAPRAVGFVPLPTTPPVERDLAVMVPATVAAAAVHEVLVDVGGRLLESASVFDEYRDEALAGRSVAWRLVFRAPNRTLRDRDVDGVMKRILQALEERLGVVRREA